METIAAFEADVSVGELSSFDTVLPSDISALLDSAPNELFLEYALEKDGVTVTRDSKIYVKPCDYRFEDPELTASVREENGAYYLDIKASRYAKNVMVEFDNADVEPDVNFFDITDGKATVLLCGEKAEIFSEAPKLISVWDVQK